MPEIAVTIRGNESYKTKIEVEWAVVIKAKDPSPYTYTEEVS